MTNKNSEQPAGLEPTIENLQIQIQVLKERMACLQGQRNDALDALAVKDVDLKFALGTIQRLQGEAAEAAQARDQQAPIARKPTAADVPTKGGANAH